MPSKQVHLKQAEHNQALIDQLFALTDDFSDWITTAAFYKALHLIEALFTQDPEIRHTTTHADRYARLAHHHRRLGHAGRANSLWAKSLRHWHWGGGDPIPPTAALAMPIPRRPTFARAMGSGSNGPPDAA